MKKIVVLLLIISFYQCADNRENNNILPFVAVNETINLNLPQFINLQVPGGWSYSNGGLKGIIIYNVNGTQFKAFERASPHLPISQTCSQMMVNNGIKMISPCDDSEFSILDGSPLTSGVEYFAREYLVNRINNSVLQITNF